MEKITVLLVEDDTICAYLSEKTLNSIEIPKQIYVAHNGKEALDMFNLCFSGVISLPDFNSVGFKHAGC